MPPGTPVVGVRDMWTLYADADSIRKDERYEELIENYGDK
jgi:hypothetical protein